MKKHLSLLLAVLMLLTSVGFNVFAESTHVHEIDTNNPNYYKVVNPTCDDKGYTIYYCVLCKDAGTLVEVSRGNYVDALSHSFDKGHYESVADGAYRKYFTCTRQYKDDSGETVTCGHKVYEKEDAQDVIYYLVSFINNRVPGNYITDTNGVKLVDTYKSTALAEYYVKSGETFTYDGPVPFLEKTAGFARHKHIGWTENSNLAIKAQADYAEGELANIQAPVTAKKVYYPVFAGEYVEHDVTFYSLEGQITNPQKVPHGKYPVYRVNGDPAGEFYPDPVKKDDLINYYDFNGWSTKVNQTEGIPTANVETVPVYNKLNYYPAFKADPKNYTVEFYTYDYKLIKSFDGVNLGINMQADDKIGAELAAFNNVQYLAKPSNATFNYEWTGKWRVIRELKENNNAVLGNFVDLKNFTITNANDYFVEKDTEGNTVYLEGERNEPKKIIRLVPEYDDRLVVYNVGIKMTLPAGEDQYYFLGDASVRVFDYNNQLIASGTTDANGEFICKLNYLKDKPYTVKITTADSKYLGESKISSTFQKDPNGNARDEAMILNICNVNMTRNPEYETHCSCIHHVAFLQPIWVRILNLLYTFFNVRYECCYDMYSTIGPLLAYTSDGAK